MTPDQFLKWLDKYVDSRNDDTSYEIRGKLKTIVPDVQTNPYWSMVTTTIGHDMPLSYSVKVDPCTNTYTCNNIE